MNKQSKTKNQAFYVVIPAKDISRPYFIHLLHNLQRFVDAESNIILTSISKAQESPNFQKLKMINNTIWIDENEIYKGLSLESVKTKMQSIVPDSTYRAGWYFQQFLKMAFASYMLNVGCGGGGKCRLLPDMGF